MRRLGLFFNPALWSADCSARQDAKPPVTDPVILLQHQRVKRPHCLSRHVPRVRDGRRSNVKLCYIIGCLILIRSIKCLNLQVKQHSILGGHTRKIER